MTIWHAHFILHLLRVDFDFWMCIWVCQFHRFVDSSDPQIPLTSCQFSWLGLQGHFRLLMLVIKFYVDDYLNQLRYYSNITYANISTFLLFVSGDENHRQPRVGTRYWSLWMRCIEHLLLVSIVGANTGKMRSEDLHGAKSSLQRNFGILLDRLLRATCVDMVLPR